jgi:gamma-glutamyl hercynylcysteine S-oxide hydrolase
VCRLLAYLGPPTPLDELLLEPAHSLLHQSWAPREQVHGVVNADGFGVGWYDSAVRAEPAVYRSARPMWADRNLPSFGPLIRSGTVLAAVRSATPPSPSEETGAPPFTEGRWLFAHNGAVEDFWGGAAAPLRRRLSDRRLASLEGATDAEVLFKLALDRMDEGATAADALRALVEEVPGRLNLMLLDGAELTAAVSGESLYTRAGTYIASEPFDDEVGWERVPDTSVVVATATTIKVEPL